MKVGVDVEVLAKLRPTIDASLASETLQRLF